MSTKPVNVDTIQQEYKDLKKELKKTLAEKKQVEKALAEMSALYALKKKAEALWGDSEED
jgi:putative methionine-R-sulfoxide reductase with GAF domain